MTMKYDKKLLIKEFGLAVDSTGTVWNTGVIQGPNCNFSGTIINSANYNSYLCGVNRLCYSTYDGN